MDSKKIKMLFILHIMLAIYSISGICSKLAAQEKFMSLPFCFYYGLVVVLLGFYAIGWQQIIKRLPLTTAFANKAVTIVWGIIWGIVIFHERISLIQVLGACLVIVGIILFAGADKEINGERDSALQKWRENE